MVPRVEGLRIVPDLGVTPQTGWGTGGLLAGREVELPPCACPKSMRDDQPHGPINSQSIFSLSFSFSLRSSDMGIR